jgi:hypothetical protein
VSDREIRITETEAQALYFGARALREVGAGLIGAGAPDLAAESYLSAAQLEGLSQRAVVEAWRTPEEEAARAAAERAGEIDAGREEAER